ncbi:MAG TPA: hypothetical protein VFM54_02675 [Micromonosporaceae bacterium]|nr:hypothetical protein [Micromonosporaceae bacterium]
MSQQVLPLGAAPGRMVGAGSGHPAQAGGIPGDEVECALIQARALVDAAMSNHRRRSSTRALVELAPDDDAAFTTLMRMVAAARKELICVLPAEHCDPDRLDTVLAEIGRVAGSAVSVRMLCPARTLRTAHGVRFLERAEGLGIPTRVAESPPQELVMVDERVALVRSSGGTDEPEALIALAPAILHTLRALFTEAWDSARPAAQCLRLGERARDDVNRQILAFLSAGYKDDTAARKLGLSVRTYRRYVAELMRDMGAASRFQAGARAAQLGLLSRCGPNGSVPGARSHVSPDGQPMMPPSTWKTAPVM